MTGEPRGGGRRRVLGVLCAAGGAACAGALVVPAAGFLAAPEGEAARGRWARVARLSDLPEGEYLRLDVTLDVRDAWTRYRDVAVGSIWIVRRGGTVLALSSVCPHLGCSVELNRDGRSFRCPCHTSRFGEAGERESGPSPRHLDRLETRLVDGHVEVRYVVFQSGTPEQRVVG